MRLTAIRAHHCASLRATNLAVDPAAPVVLIAGPNGSGKTALIEGIRFTLTGELPRALRYKKDLPALITEGEKDGWIGVSVRADGRDSEYKVSLKTGNAAGTSPPPLGNAAFTLAPQAFLALEPAARRKVLFERTGVSLKAADIVAALEADGHDPGRVQRIGAALGAGFDHAARTAKERASEARGAWQALTGETYGEVKAADWTAHTPAVWDDPAEAKAAWDAAKAEVIRAGQLLRGLEDAERAHLGANQVRADAAELPALQAQHDSLAAELDEKRQLLADATAAATDRGGWTCACPGCGVMLRSAKPGELEEYNPKATPPAKAKAQATALTGEVDRLKTQLATLARKLEHARASALMLDRLPERPTAQELEDASEAHRIALETQTQTDRTYRDADAAQTAAAQAEGLTATARDYHADVQGFTRLAQAITELPAQYLATALTTLNQALAEASGPYDRLVQLGEDMELRYGTLPYGLLSRSQQLRAAIALGVALGQRDGGLVLIDEFDLIEPAARGAILAHLAGQDRVQVVLGATLKAAPALPPDSGICAHWLGAPATTRKE